MATAAEATAPTYSSCKQLWHLISSSSGVTTSEDILRSELNDDVRRRQMEDGLKIFKVNTKSEDVDSKKRPSGKLAQFLYTLADAIGVETRQAKPILSAYLAGEFRGTKSSLRRLIDDSRFQQPLIRDIYQYYRAERLYLLQALKEVLVRADADAAPNPRSSVFAEKVKIWRESGQFMDSLIEQLREVIVTPLPVNPRHYALKSWIHLQLREQTELLQIILLYIQTLGDASDGGEWKKKAFANLLDAFQEHGFGHHQKWTNTAAAADGESALSDAVGHLEALILIAVVDLPSLIGHGGGKAADREEVFPGSGVIDRLVAALGSHSDHGPIMMAWMLAQYITKGETSLSTYHNLGERAVQLRVVAYLARTVDNEVIAANHRVAGIAKGISYSLLSVLVSAFEPDRTGMTKDVHELSRLLLRHPAVADDFWKQGYETGIGIYFASVLSAFPHSLKPLTELCTDLASSGSYDSANYVLACLEKMSVFGEEMETCSSSDVEMLMKGSSDKWRLLGNRFSNFSGQRVCLVAAGATGTSDGRLFRWSAAYNGWKFLLGKLDDLNRQLAFGLNNVCEATLADSVLITELFDAILRGSEAAMESLGIPLSTVLFSLLQKLVLLDNPPLTLLANGLRCLSLVANQTPKLVWEKLSEMGLFPFVVKSPLGHLHYGGEVNTGVVGSLLARQECVNGEYPLTSAFLDLLLACLNECDLRGNDKGLQGNTDRQREHPTTTSVLYVVQEILPVFQQWRFTIPVEKERLGQKVLNLCHMVLATRRSNPTLKALVCRKLLSDGPCKTLVNLVGTGDRVIQNAIEAQSNWENGPGVELASLVELAMTVFELLLASTDDKSALGDLNKLLCSPAAGNSQHFLLIVSQYIYHVQSLGIPISAMRLLTTIARIFPMSLLACLGSDADAIRDILIFRLESQTEDVKLKVAMLDFFSACVESQPGFIQLLIDAKNVQVININAEKEKAARDLTKGEKEQNERVSLVSGSGCLDPILRLLKETKGKNLDELHLATINFVLSLWMHCRVVAISHLKTRDSFWTDLTWPLFEKSAAVTGTKGIISAGIFRIISSETYICGGKVDDGLMGVLEKFTEEKNNYFNMWCDVVLDSAGDTTVDAANDASMFAKLRSYNKHHVLFAAWKSFLVVLTKDQPVTMSPVQCHAVSSKLIYTVKRLVSSTDRGDDDDDESRVLTSLAEFYLVLMQRWHTKCADSMEKWCGEQAELLEQVAAAYDELHPRTRAALLAVANTALKTSVFKLENEQSALLPWMEAAASILRQSLFHFENSLDNCSPGVPAVQVPILSISLMRNLVQRLSAVSGGDDGDWYDILHRQVLVQSLLSRLHHSLRAQTDMDLVTAVLGLLIAMAKTEPGCTAILSSDLALMVWMPLSDVKQATKEWLPVFQLCIQMATTLLSMGKEMAVDTSVNVAALLQEQLTTFLLSPRVSLDRSHVELMVTSASFVSRFMSYHDQWQMQHPSSLAHLYHAMCALIHVAACFLIRPSYLGMLVNKTQQHQQPLQQASEIARHRRISTASSAAATELESSSPEVSSVQNALLDAVIAGTVMLRRLSPNLDALVSGNVYDHGQYDQLLGIGFASPSFEQDDGISYGTLISMANVAIRAVTRGDRSPSPAPSRTTAASSTGSDCGAVTSAATMDRRRLNMVLEQSLTLVLEQALLSLSDPRIGSRDKQLLRRELGSELSSFTESLRRHSSFSARSNRSTTSVSASPETAAAGATAIGEENYLKFISSVVHHVFK